MGLFTGVQHLCTFNIVTPPYLHLLPNVWKALYTISVSIFVKVPCWPPYDMDKFISYAVTGPSHWFFYFGEEIIIAWTHIEWVLCVSESPIASGTRSETAAVVCPLHYHEEWWGSVPPSDVFSWMLDKGGAAGMCTRKQCLPSVLEVKHGVVLSPQCHMPQWTSPSQHIV